MERRCHQWKTRSGLVFNLGTKRLLQILSNNSWILRDDSTGLDVMGAGGWWHHAEAVSSCLIHWSAPPS